MIKSELSSDRIKITLKKIKPYLNETPFIKASKEINNYFSTNVFFKCEFLQKSGSFKARGAINNILSSDKEELEKGITAVSAGNHAIAASYAANIFNINNKIFLYESANPYRVNVCKKYNSGSPAPRAHMVSNQ